jgi:Tfp pilus assembly protein PilF
MTAAQIFQGILNGPSPTGLAVAAAVGVVLLLVAGWMLAAGKPKWLSGALSAVGLVTILAVLVLVNAQTVRYRSGESVTVTRPKYTEGQRAWARAGLITLPALVVAVGLAAWAETKRRLRSRIPRQLKAGRKLFLSKEYDAALAEYNRTIQIAPYRGEAYYGRACVYHAMGEMAQARADLDHALQCDPRLVLAYLERAKLRTDSGEFDGALADFEQLMILRGNDPELYLHRGICLLKKGQVNDAVADFHRVLKLTNHSDYADPAKNYLRDCEAGAQPAQPAADVNGAPATAAMPAPKTEDYVL